MFRRLFAALQCNGLRTWITGGIKMKGKHLSTNKWLNYCTNLTHACVSSESTREKV